LATTAPTAPTPAMTVFPIWTAIRERMGIFYLTDFFLLGSHRFLSELMGRVPCLHMQACPQNTNIPFCEPLWYFPFVCVVWSGIILCYFLTPYLLVYTWTIVQSSPSRRMDGLISLGGRRALINVPVVPLGPASHHSRSLFLSFSS
jgi:hypothetical protein